jgi:drug/metabolite transporter (DMT)-like permease
MLGATVVFSGMHATIRHASAGMHPFEIAFFRNMFGLLLLAPLLFRYGIAPLRTAHLKLHLLRGLFNITSMLCFFYALSIAPLTDVAAMTFASPIFATVLAVFVFGELIGIRRWSAILFGFAGTMVVLRPGFEGVALGPLLALFASLIWGIALLVIKVLARTESSLTITAWMMILLTPLSLIPAVFFWTWPTGEQYLWLLFTAALGTSGHLFLNQALKETDTNVVMPVDFVRLIWVAIIGYLAFGEIPDLFTWIGGAMIFASALYIAYREGVRRRREAP